MTTLRATDLKPDAIVRVAAIHVVKYRRLLEIAAGGGTLHGVVNVDECARYLALWSDVMIKGGAPEALTPAQVDEVEDAIFDGSYFGEGDRR